MEMRRVFILFSRLTRPGPTVRPTDTLLCLREGTSARSVPDWCALADEGPFEADKSVPAHVARLMRDIREIAELHAIAGCHPVGGSSAGEDPHTILGVNAHSGTDMWEDSVAADFFENIHDQVENLALLATTKGLARTGEMLTFACFEAAGGSDGSWRSCTSQPRNAPR